MPKNFLIDIDAEMMRILRPPNTQSVMPKLIKFLRQKKAGRPPAEPFEKEFGIEELKLPEEMIPKRGTRGMVYPGVKPTRSPLYPFLKK